MTSTTSPESDKQLTERVASAFRDNLGLRMVMFVVNGAAYETNLRDIADILAKDAVSIMRNSNPTPTQRENRD